MLRVGKRLFATAGELPHMTTSRRPLGRVIARLAAVGPWRLGAVA